MRITRNMSLLVILATAAMALVAPSASATNAVSYVKADGATACPAVTGLHPSYTGGCVIHTEGEYTLDFHILGFEGREAKCHLELNGILGPGGDGRVTGYHVSTGGHGDGSCTEVLAPPCTEANAAASHRFPWQFAIERDADGKTRAHYDMCIDPIEGGICQAEHVAVVTETGALGNEVQTQTATDVTVSFCELTHTLATEGVAPAELVHQRP